MQAESTEKVEVFKQDGRVREVHFKDRDGCSVGILNPDETHLQQPDAPDGVAAMIYVGEPPKPLPPRTVEGITVTDRVVNANPCYVDPEQAIEAALCLLEAASYALALDSPDEGPINRMTLDQRWRAHVAAAGLQDMTIWIHKDPRWPGYHYAIEVETGVGAWGKTEREAMDNYWAGRLDRPHDPVTPTSETQHSPRQP